MDKIAESDPKVLLGERWCHRRGTSEMNIRQDSWELEARETQPLNRKVNPSVLTPPESPRICVDHLSCDRSLERQVRILHAPESGIVQRDIQYPATGYGLSAIHQRPIREEVTTGSEGNSQTVEAGSQKQAIDSTESSTSISDYQEQATIDNNWEVDIGHDGVILVCEDEYTDVSSSQASSVASDDLRIYPEDDGSLVVVQNQSTSSGTMAPKMSSAKTKDSAQTSTNSDRSSSAKRRREKAPAKAASYQDDQSDQDDQSIRKRPRRQDSDDAKLPLFACPFFKKDSQKYQKCLHYQLRRIKDVKQHLKRQHCQPDFYCARCYTIFESANSRDKHARSQRCEVIIAPEFDGVSVEQMNKLNQQYVSRGKSPPKQWYDMWEILFPDRPQPASVYVSNCVEEVLQILHSNWEIRSGEIIAKVAESNRLDLDSQLVGQLFPLILDSLAKSSGSATEYCLPKTFETSPNISVAAVMREDGCTQPNTVSFPMNDITSDPFSSSSAKGEEAVKFDFTGIADLAYMPKIVEGSSQEAVIGQSAFDLDFGSWEFNDDTAWDFSFGGEQ